jgi:hypothetical protein
VIIIQRLPVQRPRVVSLPTKAIVSGLGLFLVFGLAGLVCGIHAQQFKPDKVASKQENSKVSLNDSPSSNALPNESPLAKRIVLLPVRSVKSVASALFPRGAREFFKAIIGGSWQSNRLRPIGAVDENHFGTTVAALTDTYSKPH